MCLLIKLRIIKDVFDIEFHGMVSYVLRVDLPNCTQSFEMKLCNCLFYRREVTLPISRITISYRTFVTCKVMLLAIIINIASEFAKGVAHSELSCATKFWLYHNRIELKCTEVFTNLEFASLCCKSKQTLVKSR